MNWKNIQSGLQLLQQWYSLMFNYQIYIYIDIIIKVVIIVMDNDDNNIMIIAQYKIIIYVIIRTIFERCITDIIIVIKVIV